MTARLLIIILSVVVIYQTILIHHLQSTIADLRTTNAVYANMLKGLK